MNILTLDIGNTVCKVLVWCDSEVVFCDTSTSPDFEYFVSLKNIFNIDGASMCSTGKYSEEYFSLLKEIYKDEVNLLSKQSIREYNVIESYQEQLGSDRLAAFIGVTSANSGEGCMIVDCGTAMTIDIIDASGKFCGGNISAGLEMRLKSLHNHTSHLPEVTLEGRIGDFGHNTESAMRDGAINGVIGEILYSYSKAKNEYATNRIFLTGGDAALLLPILKKENIDIKHDPFLVGRGLNADFLKHFYKRKEAISK